MSDHYDADKTHLEPGYTGPAIDPKTGQLVDLDKVNREYKIDPCHLEHVPAVHLERKPAADTERELWSCFHDMKMRAALVGTEDYVSGEWLRLEGLILAALVQRGKEGKG